MAERLLLAACLEFMGVIQDVNRKSRKFKQTLRRIHVILLAIAPHIKDIRQLHGMLERKEENIDLLLKEYMETGTKLVHDCSKIHMLNCLAQARYQAKLEEIEGSILKLFSTMTHARTLNMQYEFHAAVKKLEKVTIQDREGIVKFMLTARELCIAWADTPNYWTWIPAEEANSSEAEAQSESQVAKLIHVCWLDIRAKINISILSPNILYGAFFVFKQSREGAFGFDECAVEVSVKVDGQSDGTERTVHLIEPAVQPRLGRQTFSPVVSQFLGYRSDEATPLLVSSGPESEYDPRERTDGWMEVKLGEFSTHGEDKEVEMRVCEVSSNTWKGGILVKGFDIRPERKR